MAGSPAGSCACCWLQSWRHCTHSESTWAGIVRIWRQDLKIIFENPAKASLPPLSTLIQWATDVLLSLPFFSFFKVRRQSQVENLFLQMADLWGEHGVPPVCSGGLWAVRARQEFTDVLSCEWPVPVGWWQSWVCPGWAAMAGVKRKPSCKPAGETRDRAARECWGTTRLTQRKHIAPKWQEVIKLSQPYQRCLFPITLASHRPFRSMQTPLFTFGMWIPVTAFWLKVLVEIEWEFQDISLSSIMSFISETPWL